jgi:hypothetical protein
MIERKEGVKQDYIEKVLIFSACGDGEMGCVAHSLIFLLMIPRVRGVINVSAYTHNRNSSSQVIDLEIRRVPTTN